MSAKGEPATGVNTPLAATLYAETVPLPGPSCAFDTNSRLGFAGLNSLPKGPIRWAGKGEPGAAVRRPFRPTTKLSMYDGPASGPTRAPTRMLPVPLNSTSPGSALSGSGTVEPGIGVRRPPALRVKPV